VIETGVVLLKKNYRAIDPSLQATLNRIRETQITAQDLKRLHNRVFSSSNEPNINELKWTTLLVTPRNVVCQAWNHQAALRHLIETKQQIFISPALDSNIPRNRLDQLIWEIDAKTENLATWNVLCMGGPVIGT
jgi:protein-tyrosine phosphatase